MKGQSGYIVLLAIGDEAVLTVVAGPHAKLGRVFLEMRRVVEKLEKLI